MNLKKVCGFCLLFFITFALLQGCSKSDATTGLPAINDANNKNTGMSSKDLLTAGAFTSLKIEIQYMPGFAPDATSISNLTSFLSALLNKPAGISVVQKQIATCGKDAYSINDISSVEQSNRKFFNTNNQLAVYVLITDGTYTDPNVLGVAYRNTSLCLLGKKIFDNSGGIGQPSRTKLETTVVEHEFGHLLGLVDLGATMQTNHKDPDHGNHCNVQNCLMYYASETTDLLGFLVTGNIPTLDAQCQNDLHANGGK